MFISVTRVWSAINKHSVTVQGIIPDVAGLNCASVCLSVCPTQKSVSSAGAHFTNTHAPRSSYQKDEQFPLQDRSSNKFSKAAYSFVQNWTTASVLPSANSKLCLKCKYDVWNRRYYCIGVRDWGLWMNERRAFRTGEEVTISCLVRWHCCQ